MVGPGSLRAGTSRVPCIPRGWVCIRPVQSQARSSNLGEWGPRRFSLVLVGEVDDLDEVDASGNPGRARFASGGVEPTGSRRSSCRFTRKGELRVGRQPFPIWGGSVGLFGLFDSTRPPTPTIF